MRHRGLGKVRLCGIALPEESLYATREGPPGRFMRHRLPENGLPCGIDLGKSGTCDGRRGDGCGP